MMPSQRTDAAAAPAGAAVADAAAPAALISWSQECNVKISPFESPRTSALVR